MPLYLDIAKKLKSEINAGNYQQRFPSEAQLVQRYHVSRQTIIRAMSTLAAAGLIERHQGSGTVVSRKVRLTLGRIGLALPWATSAPFLEAISNVCRTQGYTLVFRNVCHLGDYSFDERVNEVRQLAQEFSSAKVAGVILHPWQNLEKADYLNHLFVDVLQAKAIPVVLIDHDICFPPQRSACDVVGVDNIRVGYIIARHLIDQGARNIAFLHHKDWAPTVTERLHGVSSAVVEAGLSWTNRRNILACAADDAKKISAAVKANSLDAIVCGNDFEAAQLLKTLRSLRIRVPERVMVTGVDDEAVSSLVSPTLTTVRQDFGQIAATAARRLFTRIHSPTIPGLNIHLPTKLIVRESTSKRRPER